MGVEGIEFEAAKIRAAELLRRSDLIKERRARKRIAGSLPLWLKYGMLIAGAP